MPQTLADLITRPPMRNTIVSDCVDLVEDEVRAKSGLSGIAIKGAYGTIKKIKPRFVPDVIDALLDDWVAKLEPYYSKWRGGGSAGTLAEFLTARSDDVAEDLLAVTDERSGRSKHKTATKLYGKMRPSAKRNVSAAVPKLGALMEKHIHEAESAGGASTGS